MLIARHHRADHRDWLWHAWESPWERLFEFREFVARVRHEVLRELMVFIHLDD
jgi:hypothetical protein